MGFCKSLRAACRPPGPAVLAIGLVMVAANAGVAAANAPNPTAWDHFTSHNPGSRLEIDHTAWSSWLGRHVGPDREGYVLVSYSKVKRSGRYLLESYIHDLEGTKISRYQRKEQLAYWINLYNALSVQQVLRLLPIDSLQELSNGIGVPAKGAWTEKLVTVEGHGLSLTDIESRILRPIWRDPRVLYALHRGGRRRAESLAPRLYGL